MTAITDQLTLLLSAELSADFVAKVIDLTQRHGYEMSAEIHGMSADKIVSEKNLLEERRLRDRMRKKIVRGMSADRAKAVNKEDSNQGKKEESKKERTVTKSKTRSRMPDDFQITERMIAFATKRGWNRGKIDAQFEKFCSHHRGKGTLAACWESTWQTWVINDYDAKNGHKSPGPKWNGIEGVV